MAPALSLILAILLGADTAKQDPTTESPATWPVKEIVWKNASDSAATVTVTHQATLLASDSEPTVLSNETSIPIALGNTTAQDFLSTVRWSPVTAKFTFQLQENTTSKANDSKKPNSGDSATGSGTVSSGAGDSEAAGSGDQQTKETTTTLVVNASIPKGNSDEVDVWISYRQSALPWQVDCYRMDLPTEAVDVPCPLTTWVSVKNPTLCEWASTTLTLRHKKDALFGTVDRATLAAKGAGLFAVSQLASSETLTATELFVFDLPKRTSGQTAAKKPSARAVVAVKFPKDLPKGALIVQQAGSRETLGEGTVNNEPLDSELWPSGNTLKPNETIQFVTIRRAGVLVLTRTSIGPVVPIGLNETRNGVLSYQVHRTTEYAIDPSTVFNLYQCLFRPAIEADWSFVHPHFLRPGPTEHPENPYTVSFTEESVRRAKASAMKREDLIALKSLIETQMGQTVFQEILARYDEIRRSRANLDDLKDQLKALEAARRKLAPEADTRPGVVLTLATEIEAMNRKITAKNQDIDLLCRHLNEYVKKKTSNSP